jgi:hypothetical protein
MMVQIYGANPGTKEYLRRQKALTDFLAMGPRRSVEGLWREYVTRRRRDPDGSLGLRRDIPTTNKEMLYRWSREDRWYEQAQAYDAEQQEQELRNLATLRVRVLEDLAVLAPLVVEQLETLLREGRQEVKLKAIETWLDRVGIVRLSTTTMTREILQETEQRKEQEQELMGAIPPDDASEEEWARWLARLHEAGS